MLSSASQNILYFCSCCLSILSEALSSFKSHSQLANELQTGFQSVENKLSKEIGGQITAQFATQLSTQAVYFIQTGGSALSNTYSYITPATRVAI